MLRNLSPEPYEISWCTHKCANCPHEQQWIMVLCLCVFGRAAKAKVGMSGATSDSYSSQRFLVGRLSSQASEEDGSLLSYFCVQRQSQKWAFRCIVQRLEF